MANFKKYLLGIAAVLILILMVISGKYLDLLWYQSMDAAAVFWIPLITGPLTKLTLGVAIALFLLVNVYISLKSLNRFQSDTSSWPGISSKLLWTGSILGSLALAFLLTAGSAMDWTVVQQFLHPVKTGITGLPERFRVLPLHLSTITEYQQHFARYHFLIRNRDYRALCPYQGGLAARRNLGGPLACQNSHHRPGYPIFGRQNLGVHFKPLRIIISGFRPNDRD